ncbi:MAG: cellulase family glycosylhydrolase [Akkermansiaceae bacterium]|nr:cellulase family glycosylhydrolase [Akkermansiaceae bacterium]MCP5542304.1 cellulase family glycosylhydrolase [Akkermansiaceae bacterium]MCP5546159.1 cellulase family glycosylhydrolase [Akkermansiaceae bacterium]
MERIIRILTTFLALGATALHGEVHRMATEARLWIKVPADSPPLASIGTSRGAAVQAPWERDAEARKRLTEVTFPIRWWAWDEAVVSFTPAADGRIELLLMGPWGEAVDGETPRQEVLWDDVTANGAHIANGGFDELENGGPAGWQSPWGDYLEPGAWPLAGAEARSGGGLGAAWMNRPLQQFVDVRKGVPVDLTVHARAAKPPGFIEPKALGKDTPAHRAASRMKRGVNLGNGWEATPGEGWGVRFTVDDIDRIADEGFDHIRVPVAWHFRLTMRDGKAGIDPVFLAEIEPVLRRALDRKLRVMLNWHHFNDLTGDPAAHRARFIAGWEAICRRFKNWPPELYLELLNEPHSALAGETLNSLYQETVSALRAIDPDRILVASPGHWGAVRSLDLLRLPDDDRIIVTVHCYDPFQFTHQGAGWVGLQGLRGVIYPGPPEQALELPPALADNHGVAAFLDAYNTRPAATNPSGPGPVREALEVAREWSSRFGRPVHLGEFGAYQVADDASRARYLRDVRRLAEERSIPWTLWEWKAGFGYWDPTTKQPRFRAALMK